MLNRFFKNKVAKNASWIILCRVAQTVLSMVIAMLSARYLGPSNYGVVNYAASVTAFFAPIVYLGFNSTLVQELVAAPEDEGRIMGTSIIMSVASAFMCMVGVTAFVSVANPGETETLIVCVLYSTLLVFQAIDLLRYWFLSKYMSKISSIAMLVSYAVAALYKIYLLATGKSVIWFAVSNSIEYMLIAILLIIMYKVKGGARIGFSWQIGKRMFAKSKYYILSSMMVTVFTHTGKILINVLLDEASTGYYSAAVAVITMPSFVFTAVVDSFRPEILKSKNPQSLNSGMIRLYAIVFYLSLAQCLGITLLARPIVDFIYGPAYAASVGALQIGIWYTIISYMSFARGIWVLATGKQKYLWIINLAGAITNVAVNFLLIPRIGILGAAVASVVTEFISNIVVCYFIKPLRESNLMMLKAMNPKVLLSLIRR